MPAPNWGTTRNFAGVKGTVAPQMWPSGGPSAQAFGAGYTTPTADYTDVIAPNDGFGVALWTGIAAISALCLIRYLLPN